MRISDDRGLGSGDTLAAAVLLALEAIDSEDDYDEDDGEPPIHSQIEENHDHRIVVSAEDVARAEAKVYDIQGDARHDHSVTVTATMFARIARGDTVVVRSSETNIHVHTITIRRG